MAERWWVNEETETVIKSEIGRHERRFASFIQALFKQAVCDMCASCIECPAL